MTFMCNTLNEFCSIWWEQATQHRHGKWTLPLKQQDAKHLEKGILYCTWILCNIRQYLDILGNIGNYWAHAQCFPQDIPFIYISRDHPRAQEFTKYIGLPFPLPWAESTRAMFLLNDWCHNIDREWFQCLQLAQLAISLEWNLSKWHRGSPFQAGASRSIRIHIWWSRTME